MLTAEAAHRTYLLEETAGRVPQGVHARSVRGRGRAALGADGPRGRALVAEIGRHRSQADPRHDVDDPYRRGPEVAAACAARIDDLLGIVVPALRPTQASQ